MVFSYQSRRYRPRSIERGFTLIEVMIALAVLAFTLPALIMTMSSQLDNMAYLKEKSAAYWLAENEISKLRLEKIISNKLPKGTTTETEEFSGRAWVVNTEAVEIDYDQFNAKIIQVNVKVRPDSANLDDDYWLANMQVIMDSAPEKAQPKIPDAANNGGPNTQPGGNNAQGQPANPSRPGSPGTRPRGLPTN